MTVLHGSFPTYDSMYAELFIQSYEKMTAHPANKLCAVLPEVFSLNYHS